MNQNLDKIIFPFYAPEKWENPRTWHIWRFVKIAMVMMMFTQAFRYAYEPFILLGTSDKTVFINPCRCHEVLYPVFAAHFPRHGIVADFFQTIYQRKKNYWSGFSIVPIVLMSFIFSAIFQLISLAHRHVSMYGARFSTPALLSLFQLATLAFVPKFSYTDGRGAAWACYFVIMLCPIILGQNICPIKYDLNSVPIYSIVTVVLYRLRLMLTYKHSIRS